MNDRPSKRKYARIERERRFLLCKLPAQADQDDFERIKDSYFVGTNLRLRRIECPNGKVLIDKFGQKLLDPLAPDDATHRQMTTLYIESHEAELFETIPARRSVKRRYRLPEQGWTFVIDVYESPPSAMGTIVCEVECDTDEQLAAIKLPKWAENEITADGDYSGAKLAE